jgi:hypothetical protein
MNDYNLNATPKYAEITGEPNEEVSLIYETTALSGLSLIIHSLNGLFNNQEATLAVSNDGVEWINMKTITLEAGADTVNRSYNDVNQSVLGSVLMFQKLRVTVPSLGSNVVTQLLISGR